MKKDISKMIKAYTIPYESIKHAEERVGFEFPKELVSFYIEVGYGFVNNKQGAINRLIDPETCADIRLREDVYEFDPDLELYSSFEDDKMIFFEVNEGVYISIGIHDNQIYYLNHIIANGLLEFIEKISENPDYWCE